MTVILDTWEAGTRIMDPGQLPLTFSFENHAFRAGRVAQVIE
jgi:hypothetical protein